METTPDNRFRNVQMPQWYRVCAVVMRVVGFVSVAVSVWSLNHSNPSSSAWLAIGFFGGLTLLILPSLPKAYLEQRNRIRGLRDGSFQEFIEKRKTKE